MAVLILAIFCVGTAELAPSGMLGDLAEDLSVTIPTAGLLVTVYALTVVVGGPLVTAASTRIRRKYLLVALLLVSVAGNVLSSLAPTFALLVAGRMLTAVIHGTFLAVCVVTAGGMAAEGKEGSAVAATQLGVNLATVLGVPLGTLVAQQLHWRATFAGVAVLALAAAALILLVIPDDGRTAGSSAAHELRVFKEWQVVGTVLATVLCSAGMFTLITYMVPLLTDVGGFPAAWVPAVLIAYGIGSIAGNALGGRYADRSADRAVLRLSWTLAAVCVLYWAAAPYAVGGAVFLLLFSMATFALIPGLQAKVLSAAADAPTLSLTANMSAFGLGAALGSWAGGRLIDEGFGTRAVTLGAAAFTALGALLIAQTVYAGRRRAAAAAPAAAEPAATATAAAQAS
ncbi:MULTISPECIES: MFS transporter [Streptomyces]|uniref:MFS transporter n=1 Tax=Streptomyces TaxID=1883 RepID=UPI0016761D48|nr:MULTISPECIES: MFS transporter [Streptomyces]MBD3580327.1 MFS transporter [Streptomyces sp. KD18]